MANEFIARKGLISLGDTTITGSLETTSNLNVGGQAKIYNRNFIIGTQVTASGFPGNFEFQAGPSTYSSQLILRPTGNPGGYNENYWGAIRFNPGNESGLTILAGNYTTNIVFGRGAPSNANPPAFAKLNNDGLRIQSSYVQNIASAEEKLHVVGNAKIEGFVTASGNLITEANITASGHVSASTYYGDGSNLTNIPAGDPFPYTGDVEITGSNSLSGNYALKVTNTSGDNILNVENDGNVGLGLADPSYKLQVRGDTNDNTDYPFRVENSSGTPLFRVRSDGYVMFGNLGENLAIDFTGGNRYLKFFNTSISAQGDTGITSTGTITLDPGSGASARIAFIRSSDAYGSVFLNQGTAADTTFPNNRGTEIVFNREVNHEKHYGVIRGDDNANQPVPLYIFSGQHTSTSVTQPLILQNLPGGVSRGNVGIGLEDPQANLHVSSSVSASTYYGDGSNLTNLPGVVIANDANNRITTAVGDGTLNAESKLTFDGSILQINATNTDGMYVKVFGGVYGSSNPYIEAGGLTGTLQLGSSATGKVFDMRGNKLAFDSDSTNTYIQTDTDTPENLEIHVDGNLELRADNEVQIFSDVDITGDITSSGDLSINGFPSVSASLAAASSGGGSAYHTWIGGRGENTSQATFGTQWRGGMSGNSLGGSFVVSADASLLTVSAGTPSVGDTINANNYKIVTALIHPAMAFTTIDWYGHFRAYTDCDGEEQHMEIWTLDDVNDLAGLGTTVLTFRGGNQWTYDGTSSSIKPIITSGSISHTGTETTAFVVVSHVPTNPATSMKFVYKFDFTVT